MSLTSLLESHRDVAKRLAALVDPSTLPPKVTSVPLAPPRTQNYRLVGTAFDYLLRFEIKRRYPHAVTQDWVAEASLDLLHEEPVRVSKDGRVRATILQLAGGKPLDPETHARLRARAEQLVADAKAAVREFTKRASPDGVEDLAAHAFRLARLDGVFRGGRVDPAMAEVDGEDVHDLLELLRIVPFNAFDPYLRTSPLLLNPTFGTYSHAVGGADADIVSGGLLLDVKTTKYPDFAREHIAQIVGYAILAERHRAEDPSFPPIREIGFYFARHGALRTIPYAPIRKDPDFPGAVKALFDAAEWDLEKGGPMHDPRTN